LRTKKILILAGVLVFLTALYAWFLFLPAQKEIQNLDRNLSKLLDEKAEQEAIAQNLAAFKREYAYQFEIDPYTTFEPLQKALSDLAWTAAVLVTTPSISNTTASNSSRRRTTVRASLTDGPSKMVSKDTFSTNSFAGRLMTNSSVNTTCFINLLIRTVLQLQVHDRSLGPNLLSMRYRCQSI
jgi:hypothetical protein